MIDIYKHTSKTSGKSYIGYTTNGIDKRWRNHCNNSQKVSNRHFHNAIRKYGEEDFTHEIIVRCSDIEIAKKAEISCIDYYDTYNNGYNMTKGGEGFSGKHSDESKRKMSKAKKGIPLSDEHKRKLSESQIGKIVSDESKKKMSKPKKQISCPHCYKTGGSNAMKRWHLDNCKQKET